MRSSRKNHIKNCIMSTLIIVLLTFNLCCCKNSGDEIPTDSAGNVIDVTMEAKKAATTVVLTVGQGQICLDEVRYYSYNTQATYEVFYSMEEEELDWHSEMSEGVSLEEAVKSTILDTMCERQALVEYAAENGIVLTEEELAQVDEKTNTFFQQSGEDILEKIDIGNDRLKEVYAKDALYLKVKESLETEQNGMSGKVYNKWKASNDVTTNSYWKYINFDTPIFE